MNTDNSGMDLLRQLPSEVGREAVVLIVMIPGHAAQCQFARELLAAVESDGPEAALNLIKARWPR